MKISICKKQFFNQCVCRYDVDKNHHPNNFDCKDFEPFGYVFINLIDNKGRTDEGAETDNTSPQAIESKRR